MDNPYETLGVEPGVTKEGIERAYRARARKSHPDTGGDIKQFKRITEARELLVCDERRKRFDATGDTEYSPKAATSAAEAMLAGMIQEAFMQDAKPPIRWMSDRIDHKRSETRAAIEQAKLQREKLIRKIDAFTADNKATKNKPGMEFVTGVLKSGLANLDMSIAGAEVDIAKYTESLTLLNDLRSRAEATSTQRNGWGGATGSFWISTTG